MTPKYDHKKIEPKWQKRWLDERVFSVTTPSPAKAGDTPPSLPTGASHHLPSGRGGRSAYVLDMFPYPSGDGLHVGHPEGYTATDIYARYLRMTGVEVLHPMGWDAFGLPAENAAIAKKTHPRIVTEKNIANFKRQIQSLGFSYDWDREVNTTDPAYYKWTQWIFLQLYKRGLAYEKESPIWWCPKDKTGLANEEVVDGKCDRCGTKVEKKMLRQWMLKITAYADRLLNGLDKLDWPESIKSLQRNWIGKSEGAEVAFEIDAPKEKGRKLFIGTKNPAKKARYVKMFLPLGIDVLTIDDFGKKVANVEVEEGDDIQKNALNKAQAFYQATGLPTLAIDEALFIDKFPADRQPGSHVRRIPGFKGRPSDDDMLNYYMREIDKHGGESLTHWEHAIAYVDGSGAKQTMIRVTSSKIVSKKNKNVKEGYPLDSLLIDLQTSKYRSELTQKEEELAIKPLTEALTDFVTSASSKRLQVEVFTTRPDTLFGATYLVLSPEHELVAKITTPKQKKVVEKYVKSVVAKSDLERTALEKEKTGVFTGAYAENPVNKTQIPIWIADYVLSSYGTGAIMAVPAHDERDFAFATKYGLEIRDVVVEQLNKRVTDGVFRKIAVGIIVNDKEEVLVQKHTAKDVTVYGLPAGGVDEGETNEQAVLREVSEETGFTNFREIQKIGIVETNYFNRVKQVNRCGLQTGFLLRLKNDAKSEQNLTESEKLGQIENFWVSKQKAAELLSSKDALTAGDYRLFERYLKGQTGAYIGEGVMINSGQFDGLPSEEGRKKIAAWLEKEGKAKFAVNFKLRDWVFSRQRYWGEPIPLVHCEQCKKDVEIESHELHFYVQDVWDRLMSGEKTVESRALNPEEPGRYFGNIKNGAILKCDFLPRKETAYFKVIKTYQFKNLEELLGHPELLHKMKRRDKLPAIAELRESYNFRPGYIEQIEKNGLIAWEIERVIPGIVPWEELPLELPNVKHYEPTGTGESPLAGIDKWVNTTCPKCGGPAKRETNTMPQWAGSCWYYLRYLDPKNDKALVSPAAMKAWLPVDLYVGGAEHAVLHLLYARFWHMVLFDAGVIPAECGDEPFLKLKNQGLILGPDGEKMSKSRGNVINPDEIVEKYGADTLRMYEMFMGPFEDAKPWDTNGIVGIRRFLDKVWRIGQKKQSGDCSLDVVLLTNKTIKKVGEDIESFKFNTAVSSLMILANAIDKLDERPREEFEHFLLMLKPFAPHISSEILDQLQRENIRYWPAYDKKLIQDINTVTIAVQVMGKLRATLTMPAGASQDDVTAAAMANDNVKKFVTGAPKKTIFVKDKLINFVV